MSTRRKVNDAEPDRISCLPSHVIDQILSDLPIREAVSTSVLSSKWRYNWTTLPDLVFDSRCVSAAFQDRSVINQKLTRNIDHVLLLHFGKINKFKLCQEGLISATAIDRWIFHLSRRSIKELVLDILSGEPYRIPWCLFSCQSLHHITLYNCLLRPPSTIEGFKNLKSLDLERVTMAQDAFEYLVSGCPLLDKLRVVDLDGFTEINIHAPNLKFLEFNGKFEDISFDNTFQLAEVYVGLNFYLNSESKQSRFHGSSNNLLNFFAHLHQVQYLDISNYFLKYLAAGVVPTMLPTPCINITYLWLSINFNDLKEISAALCVFRSSPNLKELHILARIKKEIVPLTRDSYCWEDIFLGPAMPIGVRHVWIDGICGKISELDFIKFLLLFSPVLEHMTVKPVSHVGSEVVLKLLQFKRASGQAQVIYDVKASS